MKNVYFSIIILILVFAFTKLLCAIPSTNKYLLVLIPIPILFFSMFSYRLSFILLLTTLYSNLYYSNLSLSIYYSFLTFGSFLISYRQIHFKDKPLSILSTFFIYILTTIPSFFNNTRISDNYFLTLNLIAFTLLLFISVSFFEEINNIRLFIYYFIFLNFINGLTLLYQIISYGGRAFGFAGIMYVDYLGIAIVILFIFTIFSTGLKKIFAIVMMSIFSVFSILTQTRNVWITIFIIITLCSIFIISNSKKFNIEKSKIIKPLSVFVVSIIILFISIKFFSTDLTKNVDRIASVSKIFDNNGNVQNSLVTRFFIWHTAFNAFLEHPIVGIGLYGFPSLSYNYYTIPKILFENYVKGLSPHIGYLAVLVETGILGLVGFLIFIFSIIKYSYPIFEISSDRLEYFFSLVLFWSSNYVIISLFFTDAWLWGNGIILWAIILGLLFGYKNYLGQKRKLISIKNT